MIDTFIRPPDWDPSQNEGGPLRMIKYYSDKTTILKRFRLLPEQECENEYLVKYIAEWSIKEANNGFQWKFDDTIFDKLGFSHMLRNIAFELECDLGIIYGTESNMMSDEILNFIAENVPTPMPTHHTIS